jgi:hypothetical protein
MKKAVNTKLWIHGGHTISKFSTRFYVHRAIASVLKSHRYDLTPSNLCFTLSRHLAFALRLALAFLRRCFLCITLRLRLHNAIIAYRLRSLIWRVLNKLRQLLPLFCSVSSSPHQGKVARSGKVLHTTSNYIIKHARVLFHLAT